MMQLYDNIHNNIIQVSLCVAYKTRARRCYTKANSKTEEVGVAKDGQRIEDWSFERG